MLKQRVITAVVLLALLLPALFASNPYFFMGLTVFFIAAGAWEWGRLNAMPTGVSWLGSFVCLLTCLMAQQLGWVNISPPLVWLTSGTFWVLFGALMIHRGVPGWGHWRKSWRWTGGLLVLSLAWLALAQAHHRGDRAGQCGGAQEARTTMKAMSLRLSLSVVVGWKLHWYWWLL